MNKKKSNPADGKKEINISHGKNIRMDQQQFEAANAEIGEDKDIKAEGQESTDENSEYTSVSSEMKDDLATRLEKAEQEKAEWYDKYLRLSAEFDNYRKRTLKEKADMLRSANEDLLKDILPIIDDFERGIDHIEKAPDFDALKIGVQLIYNKFNEFIKQNGLKEIAALGQPFDLDFHEAVTKIPAPSEEMKGKILDVVEKGYLLNDKVIRYAKVVVGE
jgi:molecular chaperone GrpE